MLSKKYESTRELLGALMEGGEAVKRDNPRGNETSYFFMVPKAQSPTGEEVINVPDGVDPQAFKAAGYKVPETASASSSGFGSTGSSSSSSWGSSSSPTSSWGGMSNPTSSWGNTNSSSSGWGSSTSGFGSTQNSGFGTQNPWGSNTGYGSTGNSTPSFWGSANSGLGSSSNSWGSNNGFGLNSSGNNSLGGSWNNGTNTLNNGLGSTPSYMGSNTSALGNGIGSRDNTQNALNLGGDIVSSYQQAVNPYNPSFDIKDSSDGWGQYSSSHDITSHLNDKFHSAKNILNNFLSKYRTHVSDVKPEWGDGSNIDIKEKIKDGVFSQKPAEIINVSAESRKNFPKDSLLYSIASQQDRMANSVINGMNATVGPIADFIKALKIRESGIIGADKVAHCTANYNATKRGLLGMLMALGIDVGKETWDTIIKGPNLRDSFDDFAANFRGIRGALDNKTIKEACPTHPREYLVQD